MDLLRVADELKKAVQGDVAFDAGTRALYAMDGSNYRQVPMGVVVPKTIGDVVATIRVCKQFGVPIFSRGGGTSLAGQCCNVAVVLDWTRYLNRILEINPVERFARVQPGVVCDQLRDATSEFGLTWGPDPATHTHCTFGGMIGNNSCGVRSVMAQFFGPGPRMSHNVHDLDVLLYDGTRMRVGKQSDDELERNAGEGDMRGVH